METTMAAQLTLADWTKRAGQKVSRTQLFIDGKFEKVLLAGNYVYWKNSITIQVLKTDMRQLNMEM